MSVADEHAEGRPADELPGELHGDLHAEYVASIRECANSALVGIRTSKPPPDSTLYDRLEVPEVELQQRPELLLQPTCIVRDDATCCLIEASVNSLRVSFRFGQPEELRRQLSTAYARFLMRHADRLDVLRRVPLPGYDASLLITREHVALHGVAVLSAFIAGFADEVGDGAAALEAQVAKHGRAVALEFLRALAF